MAKIRKYPKCNITGDVVLTLQNSKVKHKFKLLEISAEEIKISKESSALFNQNQKVLLNIKLKSILFEIKIKSKGIIIKIENSNLLIVYTILLIDISDTDKEQINEIVLSSCNLI